MATTRPRQPRRTGRPLGAAARRPRQGHRPRRIHPQPAPAGHAVRQDLPQHRRPRPHPLDRHQRRKSGAGRATASSPSRTCARSSRIPITARRSTTSRSSRIDKVHYRRRAGRGGARRPIRTSPSRPRQLIVAEYDELPAVFDEVEALTSMSACTRSSSPPAPSPTSSTSRAPRTPTSRSTSSCAAATSTRPSPTADHVFEHEFRTQKVLHLPFEPFVSHRRFQGHARSRSTPPRRGRRSCASRSRACSAGRRTGARQGAVSRRRLRRQALHQARGAGRRAVDDRAAAGEDRATRWRRCSTPITRHPTTFRIKSGVDADGGSPRAVRGVLERRRLCRYRPARDAEVGLHRDRPLRHRQRLDRFLRALHQPAAVRRAARLRRAAAGVGL